jgi:hypothetical protein
MPFTILLIGFVLALLFKKPLPASKIGMFLESVFNFVGYLTIGAFLLSLAFIVLSCAPRNWCGGTDGDAWMLPFILGFPALFAFVWLVFGKSRGSAPVNPARVNSYLDRVAEEHIKQLERLRRARD